MGIPEEIDIELSLQQAIQLSQEKLLPEAEYVFEVAHKSKVLRDPIAKTKKKNFPVVTSINCYQHKKKWVALLAAVNREDAEYSFYTRVIVENHKFILRYIPNKGRTQWEVIFPSLFAEYRNSFYRKYIDKKHNNIDLVKYFIRSNLHKIEACIDINRDLGLNLAFAGSELAGLSKDDQLNISIIPDGIMLGYIQDGIKQYNHFIPSWMIAEKEELQEFYEVVKMLTRERSVLTIKEKHLHYVDRFKEICTFECYLDLLTCSMSYYYK